MKTLRLLLILPVLLLTGVNASAQDGHEDLVIAQALFGKTKKAIVAEHIRLSDQEKPGFWALYDEYEARAVTIGTERLQLIKRYAAQYDSLSDESAAALAQQYLDNTAKYNSLYRDYLKKFKKLVGGLRAATLIQLEVYIQTAIQSDLQQQIPVIGELHREQQ